MHLLWDAVTGVPIGAPLTGHTDYVNSVAFSPDGERIVSGSNDKTLRLWPGPAAWPELLCSKLTANMSHKQWHDWVSPDIGYKTVCPGLRYRPSLQAVSMTPRPSPSWWVIWRPTAMAEPK